MKYNLLLLCMLTLSPLIKSASFPVNSTLTFVLDVSKRNIVQVSEDVETVVTYATSILGIVLGVKFLSHIKNQSRLNQRIQERELFATQLATNIRTERKNLLKQEEQLNNLRLTPENIQNIQKKIETERKNLDCHENILIKFNNETKKLKALL